MSYKNITIPENIKLELSINIKVSYAKHSGRYKVTCDKLKITTFSRESYAEAERRLAELVELKLWAEGFNLNINFEK